MPRIVSRCLLWAFAAFLGIWVFIGQGQEAAASLAYRGLWESNENEDGRLLQNHGHFINLNGRRDLFGRLTSEEFVNYNYRWEQEGAVRESLSPGASLKLSGDIFDTSLAVNSTITMKPQSSQADSLGFIWASKWQRRFFPELRATYDYSRLSTDSLSSRINDGRQALGTQVNWDLYVARLYYSYRRNDSTYTAYQNTNDNNLARVDVTRAWLNNRFVVSAGYEYSKSINEQRIPFNYNTTANVFLTLSQVYTGSDPIPNDIDDSTLVAAQYLLNDPDNPLQSPAYSVTSANNPNCIRLRTDGQPVHRIFLYTQNNLGPMPTTLGVSFRVYYNDNILVNPWDQLVAFAWSYDSTNQRFIIDLPALKANYVKLVVDLSLPITINFTEVQAEQVVHGALGSTAITLRTNESDRSNFSVDFQLNKSVAVFYNLLLSKAKEDSIFRNESETHNGGVRMQNSAGNFRSILSYGLSRNHEAGGSETQAETYAFNVNKVILPTLSVAFAASRDDTSLAGARVSTRNRYAIYADALLYPDLNSQLESVYLESASYSSVAAASNQDSLDSKITFTSRFSPSLNVSLFENYGIINQTGQVSKNQNTLGLSGNWQVSDLFSINASMTRNSGSALTHDSYLYSTSLVVGYGSGFEFQAGFSLQVAEINSQSGRVSLRWASNRNVSWEIGCSYAENDAVSVSNVYKFYTKVAVNFSTL